MRIYGFGVDWEQDRLAKYHYFDDVVGERSRHSFSMQARFLRALAKTGRVLLCTPGDDSAGECAHGTSPRPVDPKWLSSWMTGSGRPRPRVPVDRT